MRGQRPLQQTVGLTIIVLVLAGCGGVHPEPTATSLTTETYDVGESITFAIDDSIYACEDELPYGIVQITEGEEREVMLEHSCLGIAGSGVDQYCEDGQTKTVQVVFCGDVMLCEETEIHKKVTWDQQEYVQVSEECADETIYREIKQQVPEGTYQVYLRIWEDEQVQRSVIKRFTITSNESDTN